MTNKTNTPATGRMSPVSYPRDHFCFQDLPKEVRWMICDYFPEPAFRPLLENNKEHFLHFASWKMPTALLQVNRFFHDEVSACLRQCAYRNLVSLLCCHNPKSSRLENFLKYVIPKLVEILWTDRLYDTRAGKVLTSNSRAGFDRWSLKAPILYLKAFSTRFWEHVNSEWDDSALQAFLRHSLLSYRREPDLKVHVQYLVDNYAEVARVTSMRDLAIAGSRRGIVPACVYTVVSPGALPEDLSRHGDWQHSMRSAGALELKLLIKRRMWVDLDG